MGNILISFLQFMIDNLFLLLEAIIQFLPDSPFSSVDFSPINQFLGYINWLIPVGLFVTFLGLWTSGVLIYYVYTIILRVTQTID